MKRTSLLALIFVTLGSTAAHAQFAKPEDAVKYRKGSFFVMSQHFGRIGAMAQGKVSFNAAAAQENAATVAMLAKLPWTAFGEGTDMVPETKAKAAIWEQPAKFKEAGDKLQKEAENLSAAAKTGNLDAVKKAFTATAGTCKACHDQFKDK